MNSDGSIILLTGTVEIGQGARTAVSQIVAEELSIPLEPHHRGSARYRRDSLRRQHQRQQLHRRDGAGVRKELPARLETANADMRVKRSKVAKPDQLTLKHGRIHAGKGQWHVLFRELMHKDISDPGPVRLLYAAGYQDVKSKKAALGRRQLFGKSTWGGAEVEVDP